MSFSSWNAVLIGRNLQICPPLVIADPVPIWLSNTLSTLESRHPLRQLLPQTYNDNADQPITLCTVPTPPSVAVGDSIFAFVAPQNDEPFDKDLTCTDNDPSPCSSILPDLEELGGVQLGISSDAPDFMPPLTDELDTAMMISSKASPRAAPLISNVNGHGRDQLQHCLTLFPYKNTSPPPLPFSTPHTIPLKPYFSFDPYPHHPHNAPRKLGRPNQFADIYKYSVSPPAPTPSRHAASPAAEITSASKAFQSPDAESSLNDLTKSDFVKPFSLPGTAYCPVYFDSPTSDPSSDPPEAGYEIEALDFRWEPFIRKTDSQSCRSKPWIVPGRKVIPQDQDITDPNVARQSCPPISSDHDSRPSAIHAPIENKLVYSLPPGLMDCGSSFAPPSGIFISPSGHDPSSPLKSRRGEDPVSCLSPPSILIRAKQP
jgi:hypothetical protein